MRNPVGSTLSTFALLLAASSLIASSAFSATLQQMKAEQITVMNAHLQTFNLGGKDRTGYDPYAHEFNSVLQLQTESTAMALYYGGVANLGLSAGQLQEIYDFFEYMHDVDGWAYSDYKVTPGREFKKALHVAWALVAIEILEDHGIVDTAGLKADWVNALEAGIDSNGYMAGDPNGSEGLRTKFIQSLPFMLKAAQDLGDAGAIAKARLAIDFYMANCIDAGGDYDVWRIDASGTKTLRVNAHESMEFIHGLVLFHDYETDAPRKSTIETHLVGLINEYASGNWTYTNAFGEAYMANDKVSGTVNTLANFQFQYIIEQAHAKGLVTNGNAAQYLDIYDRIKLSGFSDPEVDNNFYYLAHPDTGAAISSNINSYSPGYVIAAADAQIPVPPVPLAAPIGHALLVLSMGALGAWKGLRAGRS
jgi:hypothetical protein